MKMQNIKSVPVIMNFKISIYFIILNEFKCELKRRKIVHETSCLRSNFFLLIGKIDQHQKPCKMPSRNTRR